MSVVGVTKAALIDITWGTRRVHIEHAWLEPKGVADRAGLPWMVFLHEGLGSLSMWRSFPQQVCDALGFRGLVYSRPGYGGSTPREHDERWQPDFMHRQAHEVLPALYQALGVDAARSPPWLFGHSDGGSIALLHAAQRPQQVAGLVVVAPHIMAEAISLASILQARIAYQQTDLRTKLARHHQSPDSAFWGWNDAWLNPAFEDWSIAHELGSITCPVLAVQGVNDEYGTMAQIKGIAERTPHTQLLELQACGHSPHRDQPQALIDGVLRFVGGCVKAH